MFVIVDKVFVGLPVHCPQLNHFQEAITHSQTQTVITTPVTQGDVTLVQLVCVGIGQDDHVSVIQRERGKIYIHKTIRLENILIKH